MYLYTVDDLGDVIEEGRQRRVEAAGEAEGIIDRQVAEFMAWMRGRRVSSVVVRVRESAVGARDEVLAKARRRLRNGEPADEVVEYVVARTLTNKLLHAPSTGIREAGASDRPDVVEAARALFGITGEDEYPDPASDSGPGGARTAGDSEPDFRRGPGSAPGRPR